MEKDTSDAKVIIDTERIESLMQESNVDEILKLAKYYKEKKMLEGMLDLRYCSGKCNIFHAIVKYSDSNTVLALFDFVISTMGNEYFLNSVNVVTDRYARTVLIIAAKHCPMDLLLKLLRDYGVSPNHYCRYNKMSALSYAFKRKKYTVVMEILRMMDPVELTEEQREWFKEDLLRIRNGLPDEELVQLEWLHALTKKHIHKARISKLHDVVRVSKVSFEGHRLQQTMRHIALQLFMRWKVALGVNILEDVQLMYVEKSGDKKNPFPRPCLFIACTPPSVAEIVQNDLKNKSMKEILLTEYDIEDGVGQVRSDRYRRKLKERLYKSDHHTKLTKESKKVGELLKADVKRIQKIAKVKKSVKLPYFEYQEKTVYLVLTEGYPRRGVHAEEVLCDIAYHLKTDHKFKFHIYGKTRPCLSCVGHMTHSNADGFNKHFGYFWLSAAENQDADAAQETLSLIFDSPSHVTYFPEEVIELPNYDTPSDSD